MAALSALPVMSVELGFLFEFELGFLSHIGV